MGEAREVLDILYEVLRGYSGGVRYDARERGEVVRDGRLRPAGGGRFCREDCGVAISGDGGPDASGLVVGALIVGGAVGVGPGDVPLDRGERGDDVLGY